MKSHEAEGLPFLPTYKQPFVNPRSARIRGLLITAGGIMGGCALSLALLAFLILGVES